MIPGRKFQGAATADDGRVIFAPDNADIIGVFNPLNDVFYGILIRDKISLNYKFFGVVKTDNGKIVFTPYWSRAIGVFDPQIDEFFFIDI